MNDTKFIALDCGRLRIEWQRLADRWQHTVGILMDDHFCSLITSIEGLSDDLWPTSPTLQELHIESRGKDSVAFLTGMAGSTHWSASVLCEPQADRATVEIACRCKGAPEWMGSLYQVPEWLEAGHEPHSIEMPLPNSALRVVAQTPDLLGSVPQLGPKSDQRGEYPWTANFINRVKGFRRTLFFAPQVRPEAANNTVRWKYLFEVVGR